MSVSESEKLGIILYEIICSQNGDARSLEVSLGSRLKGHFPRLSRRGQQGAILQRKIPAWDPPAGQAVEAPVLAEK